MYEYYLFIFFISTNYTPKCVLEKSKQNLMKFCRDIPIRFFLLKFKSSINFLWKNEKVKIYLSRLKKLKVSNIIDNMIYNNKYQ